MTVEDFNKKWMHGDIHNGTSCFSSNRQQNRSRKKTPKIQRLIDLDMNHDYSHWRCDNEEDGSLST